MGHEILRPCCVSLLGIPRMPGRKPYAALQAGHTGARLLTCPRHGRVSPTRHRGCLWEAQALRVRVAVPRTLLTAPTTDVPPARRAWTLLTCPRHVGRNRFARAWTLRVLRMTLPVLVVKFPYR